MRVLVYGGRNCGEQVALYAELDALKAKYGHALIVIQGGATGADALAETWAYDREVHCAEVGAYWYRPRRVGVDRSAGPRRNTAMLLLDPNLAIELPGGRGTEDMRQKLERAGIPIKRLPDTSGASNRG